MSKNDVVDLEGVVMEALPNFTFKVQLENGHMVTAYVSGKMRNNFIKIVSGDRVTVELSLYDLNLGRITRRGK